MYTLKVMVNFLFTGDLIALDKTEWHSGSTLTYVWEAPGLILSPQTLATLTEDFHCFSQFLKQIAG